MIGAEFGYVLGIASSRLVKKAQIGEASPLSSVVPNFNHQPGAGIGPTGPILPHQSAPGQSPLAQHGPRLPNQARTHPTPRRIAPSPDQPPGGGGSLDFSGTISGLGGGGAPGTGGGGGDQGFDFMAFLERLAPTLMQYAAPYVGQVAGMPGLMAMQNFLGGRRGREWQTIFGGSPLFGGSGAGPSPPGNQPYGQPSPGPGASGQQPPSPPAPGQQIPPAREEGTGVAGGATPYAANYASGPSGPTGLSQGLGAANQASFYGALGLPLAGAAMNRVPRLPSLTGSAINRAGLGRLYSPYAGTVMGRTGGLLGRVAPWLDAGLVASEHPLFGGNEQAFREAGWRDLESWHNSITNPLGNYNVLTGENWSDPLLNALNIASIPFRPGGVTRALAVPGEYSIESLGGAGPEQQIAQQRERNNALGSQIAAINAINARHEDLVRNNQPIPAHDPYYGLEPVPSQNPAVPSVNYLSNGGWMNPYNFISQMYDDRYSTQARDQIQGTRTTWALRQRPEIEERLQNVLQGMAPEQQAAFQSANTEEARRALRQGLSQRMQLTGAEQQEVQALPVDQRMDRAQQLGYARLTPEEQQMYHALMLQNRLDTVNSALQAQQQQLTAPTQSRGLADMFIRSPGQWWNYRPSWLGGRS